MLDKIFKTIWSICGILLLIVLLISSWASIQVIGTIQDIRVNFSDISTEDLRHGMELVSKQLEVDAIKWEARRLEWETKLKYGVDK